MSPEPDAAVALYLDVVCPYSYMMATAVAEASDRAGLAIAWRLVPLAGRDPDASAADAAMHAARWDAAWPAAVALAAGYGLAPRRPSWATDGRLAAAAGALLRDAPAPVARAFHLGLFEARFAAAQDVGERAVVARVAAAAGAGEVSRRVAALTEREIAAAAAGAVAEALARGIAAVPTLTTREHLVMGAQPPAVVRGLLAQATARGPSATGGVSLADPPAPAPEP